MKVECLVFKGYLPSQADLERVCKLGKKTRLRRAKFYIDECVPDWVQVNFLSRGYDATLSKEDLGPKTGDRLLLKQAKKQGGVFITIDRGIKDKLKDSNHPGIVVIVGKDLSEDYVCGALDTLLQWGAKRREDYKGLYIEISENQTSITFEDGKTLVLRAGVSMTLREGDGAECHDSRIIEMYSRGRGII